MLASNSNRQGYDPDSMSQDDIDKSIEYLFPSGLNQGLINEFLEVHVTILQLIRGKTSHEAPRGNISQAERCGV